MGLKRRSLNPFYSATPWHGRQEGDCNAPLVLLTTIQLDLIVALRKEYSQIHKKRSPFMRPRLPMDKSAPFHLQVNFFH